MKRQSASIPIPDINKTLHWGNQRVFRTPQELLFLLSTRTSVPALLHVHGRSTVPGLDAPLRETCSATIHTPPCNDVPFGYAGSLRMPAALRLTPLAIPVGANGSAANVVVVVIGSAHLRHGRYLPSFPGSHRSLPPSDKYSGGGCLIRSRFSDHHTAKRRSHSGAGIQSIFPGRSRHMTHAPAC